MEDPKFYNFKMPTKCGTYSMTLSPLTWYVDKMRSDINKVKYMPYQHQKLRAVVIDIRGNIKSEYDK